MKRSRAAALAVQICTDPSPIRKFMVAGWLVENQATPLGGDGGGVQSAAPTPTANARGAKDRLPKTRLLAMVPHGFVPPGPEPPPPPEPPHFCKCSPAKMVTEAPSGMARVRLSRVGGVLAVGKTPPLALP